VADLDHAKTPTLGPALLLAFGVPSCGGHNCHNPHSLGCDMFICDKHSMEQLLRANVGRAATCRGPWPRTHCFTAPSVKHTRARSAVRVRATLRVSTLHLQQGNSRTLSNCCYASRKSRQLFFAVQARIDNVEASIAHSGQAQLRQTQLRHTGAVVSVTSKLSLLLRTLDHQYLHFHR
jgi:hypothetical protein